MKDDLVRFGIAMEGSLLAAFDKVVEARGGSRSEAFRDLARAEVTRTQLRKGVEAVGTLTIVYDHHVRELNDRLTELQHDLGDQIFATTHVHLDHHRCLETIILRGRADQLQSVADRIIAIRGVIHGALSLFTEVPHKPVWQRQAKTAAKKS
jgi:CopG family nickel-responsive transcriptional regulator